MLIFLEANEMLLFSLQAIYEIIQGGGGVGGGGGALCFQGFDPLVLFNDIHVRPTNPKICLKASPAPIYIKFEGKRAEKTQFFCQNFPKNAQKLLFDQFFFKKFT